LKNCRAEWRNYYNCLHTVNQNFNTIHLLTDGQYIQLETDVQGCFRQEGCKDPFVNGNYRNSRRACLNQQKNKMIADLNACLRRQIPQSDVPTAALDNGEFTRWTAFMNGRARDQNICAPQANKGRINTCIRQAVARHTGKARQTGAQCPAKQNQCDSTISPECYQNWQRYFKPTLTRCQNDLRTSGRLQNYAYAYSSCLRTRAPLVIIANSNEDPNTKYFNYLPSYYSNTREICARKNVPFG